MSTKTIELRPLQGLGNATAQRDATVSATDAQPKRLKALANAVLGRNRQRNQSATEGVEACNLSATHDRRQRVLAMLAEHPTAPYALVTDEGTDPEAVILTLAVRAQATCELRIPRDRYDPFLLLDLIERHGGTVH